MYIHAALTVDKIIEILCGLKWRRLGQIFFIPHKRLDEIASKYPNKDQRKMAIVRHWPSVDPLISWRRIIHNLDSCYEHEEADKMRHYAEELTGIRYKFIS